MSAVRFVSIWCDEPDCEAESAFEPSARAARLVAKGQGWVVRHGKDFCPEHSLGRSAKAQQPVHDGLLPNLAGDRIRSERARARSRVTFDA